MPLFDDDEIMAEQTHGEDDLMHKAPGTEDPNDFGLLSFRELLEQGDQTAFFGDHDYRLDDPPKTEDELKAMSEQEREKEEARINLQRRRGLVFSQLRVELQKLVRFRQLSKFGQLSKSHHNIN